MTRQCQILLCISGLVAAACQQGSRDVKLARDSVTISTDTATLRDLESPKASTPLSTTTPAQEGTFFEQQWIPGQPDERHYENRSRFLARAHYFSTGRLMLWLDTSITRTQQTEPSSDFAGVDSLTIAGLGATEFFTKYCRVGEGLADGQLGGVARTLVQEKWERPRLAWVFDTVKFRIRSVPTDSVSCAVPASD